MQEFKELVCKYIGVAIDAGSAVAVAPLTAVLAPEIGPLAPIVAEALVWIAKHAVGGLAGWLCEPGSQPPAIGTPAQQAAGRAVFKNILTKGAMAVKQAGQAIQIETARVERLQNGKHPINDFAMGDLPLYPLTTGLGYTTFTPQPIPKTYVGIATWPRMDAKQAASYNQIARYQRTWNGQPNATYPAVGFVSI